jgi:hypothetical protein
LPAFKFLDAFHIGNKDHWIERLEREKKKTHSIEYPNSIRETESHLINDNSDDHNPCIKEGCPFPPGLIDPPEESFTRWQHRSQLGNDEGNGQTPKPWHNNHPKKSEQWGDGTGQILCTVGSSTHKKVTYCDKGDEREFFAIFFVIIGGGIGSAFRAMIFVASQDLHAGLPKQKRIKAPAGPAWRRGLVRKDRRKEKTFSLLGGVDIFEVIVFSHRFLSMGQR